MYTYYISLYIYIYVYHVEFSNPQMNRIFQRFSRHMVFVGRLFSASFSWILALKKLQPPATSFSSSSNVKAAPKKIWADAAGECHQMNLKPSKTI